MVVKTVTLGIMCACIVNMNHREVLHNVFLNYYAFSCIIFVHEGLRCAFSSTGGSVMYAGFLMRVPFKSTFMWQFGQPLQVVRW